jgi:hypothetical protein
MKNFANLILAIFYALRPVGSPILTARTLYVFFSMLQNGMSFFGKVRTTPDFPKHTILLPRKTDSLLTSILEYSFSLVNAKLLGNRIPSSTFDDLFPIVRTDSYQALKRMPVYKRMTDILQSYYDARDNDGWKQMNDPIPLPEGVLIENQVQD